MLILLIAPLTFYKIKLSQVLQILIPNVLALISILLLSKEHHDISVVSVLFIGLIILELALISWTNKDEPEVGQNCEQGELLPYRKSDMDRLCRFFTEEKTEGRSVIGINGEWGSGKSFLVDKFVAENQEVYDIIKIGLLELNSHEIAGQGQDQSITNAFFLAADNLLRSYGYLTKYSPILLKLTGNSRFLDNMKAIFFPTYESVDEAIEHMKLALEKLPKRIIVVIEDIDRINDSNNIRAIFSICEKFACKRINMILEFSPKKLSSIDSEFTFDYIEKYVPYIINLSPVTFESVTDFLLDHDYKKDVGLKDAVDNLMSSINTSKEEIDHLIQALGIKVTDFLSNVNIRDVRSFLDELKLFLPDVMDKRKSTTRINALAGIIWMKYFDNKTFKKIKFYDELLYSIGIEVDGAENNEFWNLSALYKCAYAQDENISEIDLNSLKNKLVTEQKKNPQFIQQFRDLVMLGYKLPEQYSEISSNLNYIERIKYNNDEIDHTVWNFLANGISKYTEDEIIATSIDEILRNNDSNEFKRIKYDRFIKEKRINNPYVTIVKAYALLQMNKRAWKRLLTFIRRDTEKKDFGPDKFEILYYCARYISICKDKDLLKICIKLFLAWTQNDRANYNYLVFYLKCLNAFIEDICVIGYVDNGYTGIDDIKRIRCVDDNKYQVKLVLDYLDNEISELITRSKKCEQTCLYNDCKVIQRFIKRNTTLMSSHKRYSEERMPDILELLNEYEINHKAENYALIKKKYNKQDINNAYRKNQINVKDLIALIAEFEGGHRYE